MEDRPPVRSGSATPETDPRTDGPSEKTPEGLGITGSEPSREPPSTALLPSAESTERRLACPFYVLDRELCPNAGILKWFNVHRLKEHIYRRHRQAVHCPRCGVVFELGQQLHEHIIYGNCEVRPHTQNYGITPVQMLELRKRRKFHSDTQEERWFSVWDILFPDKPRPPSPYFPQPSTRESLLLEHESFRSFLLETLPARILRDVENRIRLPEESRLQGLDQMIKDTIKSSFEDFEEYINLGPQLPAIAGSTDPLRTTGLPSISSVDLPFTGTANSHNAQPSQQKSGIPGPVETRKEEAAVSASTGGIPGEPQGEDEADTDNECTWCKKRFSDRKILRRHIRTLHVAKVKVVACSCGRQFNRRDNLLRHMRTCLQAHRESQKKPRADRTKIAEGHDTRGEPAVGATPALT